MDRFIVLAIILLHYFLRHLKSNMDRFIGSHSVVMIVALGYLKSNMDRFIGVTFSFSVTVFLAFKIQYG